MHPPRTIASHALSYDTREDFLDVTSDMLRSLVDFKLHGRAVAEVSEQDAAAHLQFSISDAGDDLRAISNAFLSEILPRCSNFASPQFLGFPDSGNGLGALLGSVVADFVNANLINQTFCAPAASLVEMGLVDWLRGEIGFVTSKLDCASDIGGCFTNGGTLSNAVALMGAREKFAARSNTALKPVIIVPEIIGHYSIRAANVWLGVDASIVACPTQGFRYDLPALEARLAEHGAAVMAIVAYAGDSRTGTVDRFEAIDALRAAHCPDAWLHIDACHGFPMLFHETLREKLRGIALADSVTLDPHKVLLAPYTVSAVLFRDQAQFAALKTKSDLIMSERYSLGQTTPLVGSKSWVSLKLWFQLKALGRRGLHDLVEHRRGHALKLASTLEERGDFVLISEPDNNGVVFQYAGEDGRLGEPERSAVNRAIHARLLQDGNFHVHTYPLYVAGENAAPIFPLRVYFGNPLTQEGDIRALVDAIVAAGHDAITGDTDTFSGQHFDASAK